MMARRRGLVEAAVLYAWREAMFRDGRGVGTIFSGVNAEVVSERVDV